MAGHNKISVRRPVRRKGASRYILLSLISFAVSVSLTRLFLQLTGYPQIGSGELHIAHVLWGGLLLFISTLIPLLYANRWAYSLAAIINGAGVGLFIDEVGKFITQNNNYFYPAAAPIIYALFLITALVYTQVRRPRYEDSRAEMYNVIDELEEVLDRDLSEDERTDIINRLHRINQETKDENLSRLGKSLEEFIESNKVVTVPHVPDLWERSQAGLTTAAQKIINRERLRLFLIAGLLGLGIWALITPTQVIMAAFSPDKLQVYLQNQMIAGNLRGMLSLKSFEIQIGLQVSVGLALIVSAVLLTFHKDKQGIALGYLGLLLLLTIVNLLVFYFDQFSTIIGATIQLIFLLAVFYYRNHFIQH